MAMALQGMVGMGCPSRIGFSKVSQQRAASSSLSCSLTARPASVSAASCFSGVSLRPCLNLGGSWLVKERGSTVKVMAKKPSMACTKRSKSRLTRARTSGFRARLATPGGRNILQRRRAKGRWILCPSTNPNSGKRA